MNTALLANQVAKLLNFNQKSKAKIKNILRNQSLVVLLWVGIFFDDDDISEVCRIARFNDVVKQLPNGLETNIQEKGVNLSGGQRQQLVLARGVLAARTSDIVLLDELTSSVDPKTELAIYRELLREFADEALFRPCIDYICYPFRLHLYYARR